MTTEPLSLEPCPFCQHADISVFNDPDESGRDSFGCQCGGGSCAVIGPQRSTRAEAVAAWNCRALSGGKEGDVEALIAEARESAKDVKGYAEYLRNLLTRLADALARLRLPAENADGLEITRNPGELPAVPAEGGGEAEKIIGGLNGVMLAIALQERRCRDAMQFGRADEWAKHGRAVAAAFSAPSLPLTKPLGKCEDAQ